MNIDGLQRLIVLEHLREALLHGADLNAALGYVVDPKLPAPEVFERPGWRVVWAPPESYRFEVHRTPGPHRMVTGKTEYDPFEQVEVETVVIEPAVRATIHFWEAHESWAYGLGFNADERIWVVFSWPLG